MVGTLYLSVTATTNFIFTVAVELIYVEDRLERFVEGFI